MNIYKYDIVFQEVPDHVSLAFYVCGCPLKCPGCHSPELWTEKTGTPLTTELLQQLITRYRGRITCVLFLGGEWHETELCHFLKSAITIIFAPLYIQALTRFQRACWKILIT
ncbi:4Fe-4S cluster-binding domain-containing protein [Bdellovibrio bacteriovorus]|uniref:4Fe-4S cluster-binding domain-containing protein n=1 Tax=Bdellovibrio bacteriovorus TaxID=959 RepID=UPI0035A6E96E